MIADRYTLDREIGRGGMGAVWLGRDELLGRPVALKKVGMPPAGAGDNPEIERAQREAKLAASLTHPHVVSIFDLAPDGDSQWLVMEYVEGTNLAELIKANGTLPPDQAAPILAQTADALIAAHHAGVVHRDVKPSNILVTPEGVVKLSDFGIARTVGDASLTQTGLVTGSPAYLSPEVASGRSAAAASDIWSLGATAFHAVEGHPPYDVGDNLLGALYRIVHEEPPRPAAPGWLAPLFEATMALDPEDRWDALQVRDFLHAGPGATATPPPTRPRRAARTHQKALTPTVPTAVAGEGAQHTQVLQAVRTQSREVPQAGHAGPRRTSGLRNWLIGAVAVIVLLIGAIVLTTFGGDDDRGADPRAAATPTPSATATPSAEATEDGMKSFITDYLSVAPRDQDAAFRMLTPAFQQASADGYQGFWGNVSDLRVLSLDADPTTLVVTYDYAYKLSGREKNETISLRLSYTDGRYLIDGPA